MSENKVQIVVEVDAKTGQATIRQLGEEMETAGRKGAAGFDQASTASDRVRQAISKANPTSQQLGVEMDTAGKKGARGFGEASAGADRLHKAMAPALGLAQQLGLAFGAYEMVQGGDWALQTADSMLALDNRMLLSARNTADYVAAQETVVGVAKQTYQDLGAVGQLYTRLAIATKDLDVTQQDLADTTKAVNIAVALGGSTAQVATAGVQQFSQAMSLGRLQGDEFRSMMENIPMVAMAVIDGMGLTVAEFRAQSEQGLITTERMIEALKKKLPELEAQQAAMPSMVDMAMNKLHTSASLYVEEVNQGIGASASMAHSIGWLGENLDTVAKGGTMALAGGLAVLTSRGISAVVAEMPRMIALVREYAIVTETATRASGSLALVTETTSRVSLGAAASRLMTMPNIIGAVTTALTLGATAWAIWGDHAEEAADKAAAELDQLRRYNAMMKELSDPEIKLREAEAQRAAARARVEELAAAGHRHVNALGQIIVTGDYAEAERALKGYEEKYTLVQENMALSAKGRADKEVDAEMSIAAFEKKMAGERMVASATGLQKDLLDIEKRKDEAIAAARSRFKDTTEFARAEAAINSRYAGEEAKAREAAGKKARDEEERTRKEYVKTRAEYEKKTALAGLEGIHKELAEIGQEAAKLRAENGSQDWIDVWQEEAEQAAIAKDRLKEQKEELEKLGKVRDAYHEAVMASLPEEQQAVARVTAEYRKQQLAVLDALNAGEISADEAWARSEALSQRETEATRKALDNLRAKGDQVEKVWDHTYERLQDLTGDWLRNHEISLDTLVDLAWDAAAEYVNAWLWAAAKTEMAQQAKAGQSGFGGLYSTALAGINGVVGNPALTMTIDSLLGLGGATTMVGAGSAALSGNFAGWADTMGSWAGVQDLAMNLVNLDSSLAGVAEWVSDLGGAVEKLPVVGELGLGGTFAAGSALYNFSEGNIAQGVLNTINAGLYLANPVLGAAWSVGSFVGNAIADLFGWGSDEPSPPSLGISAYTGAAPYLKFGGASDPNGANRDKDGSPVWSFASLQMHGVNTNADAAMAAFHELREGYEVALETILGSLGDHGAAWLDKWVNGLTIDITTSSMDPGQTLKTVNQKVFDALVPSLNAALDIYWSETVSSVSDTWAVLSDSFRAKTEAAVQALPRFDVGGDPQSEMSDLNTYLTGIGTIQAGLEQIGSITSAVRQAIDDQTLSQYELALDAVNDKLDAWSGQLRKLGVDLEKFPELERARQLLMQEATNQYIDQLMADHGAVRSLIDSIADQARNLRYSDYNPALPAERLAAADSDYATMFAAAAQGEDGAAAKWLQFVDTYLAESQAVNKSSAAYLADWQRVQADMGALGLAAADRAETELSVLQSVDGGMALATEYLAGIYATLQDAGVSLPGHADGLPWVPYDNYTARLHRGEAVIDAATMSGWRQYGVPVQGGGGITREQIQSIVEEIVGQMGDQPLHLTVVTADGKKLVEQTISTIRERSRNGEIVIHAEGVA